MSEALDKIAQMKAAAQASVDEFIALENAIKSMDEEPKESELQKKYDALKAAVEVEINDAKADTERLEAAVKPVLEEPKEDAKPEDKPEGEQPGLPGDAVPPEEVKGSDITPLPGA